MAREPTIMQPPATATTPLAQHAINACPTDPKPAGDFGGPDALRLQSGYLSSLSARSRHTPLIAMLPLGLGDSFALARQHSLPFGLPQLRR